jgi:hypothetical protein
MKWVYNPNLFRVTPQGKPHIHMVLVVSEHSVSAYLLDMCLIIGQLHNSDYQRRQQKKIKVKTKDGGTNGI